MMRSGCTQSGCHIRHEHCVGVVVRVWEFGELATGSLVVVL